MGKYFTTFNFDNMEKLDEWLHHIHDPNTFSDSNVQELLSTSNVNFVLSGINRLQSTLLCEAGFSYVQQSQRYVPMNKTSVSIIGTTPEDLHYSVIGLVNKAISLYQEMTALKDPTKKGGRLTRNDFVHGITYEEARCILPLCISTNITISMSADKLIDLVYLFNKYNQIFSELRHELWEILPTTIASYVNRASAKNIDKTDIHVKKYYKMLMGKLNQENNVYPINIDELDKNIAIGALASQNFVSPDTVYEKWGDGQVANSEKIIKNVTSYGHTGILEQGRTTFAMQCSLATYHQVIRHRHQNIRRESFSDILKDPFRETVIPESILNNSMMSMKVKSLLRGYTGMYEANIKEHDSQYIMQFLLNCMAVKFVVSSNIRHDLWIFRERLCYTAQEEIRKLYFKKFDILYNEYPYIMKQGLPPCVLSDKCKEGKLTCHRAHDALKEYGKYLDDGGSNRWKKSYPQQSV